MAGLTALSSADKTIRMLFTSLPSSARGVAPAVAWSQAGGRHDTLRGAIVFLIGVAFWSEVLAMVLLAPFEPIKWPLVAYSYGWSVLLWLFLRPDSIAADTTPIPYFLVLENLGFSIYSFVESAPFIVPIVPECVRLAALVLLLYVIPIRHAHILRHAQPPTAANEGKQLLDAGSLQSDAHAHAQAAEAPGQRHVPRAPPALGTPSAAPPTASMPVNGPAAAVEHTPEVATTPAASAEEIAVESDRGGASVVAPVDAAADVAAASHRASAPAP